MAVHKIWSQLIIQFSNYSDFKLGPPLQKSAKFIFFKISNLNKLHVAKKL